MLTGSSTVALLALEIAKRFEQQNPGVRIDVQSGGSSRGVADAPSGLAGIGMVSRALKPEENKLTAHVIAMDGVGIIAHSGNPVRSLTDAQIKAIYTGRITNWNAVGGKDGRITVVNKAEGRSTLELFLQHFALKNSEIKPQVVIGENQQGIKTVAGNPGAIGYVSIGSAEFEEAQGTPIKLLPMAGVAASVANVRNGRFPLARPLNLVTKGAPAGWSRRFIDFARSGKVNDLVEAQFFRWLSPMMALPAAGAASILLLVLGFLLREAWPLLDGAGWLRFFADQGWHPLENLFGLAPMLWATLAAASGALLLAAPVGLAGVIFTRFFAPPPVARLYRMMLALLAGIPSVVYCLWGLTVLVRLIARWQAPGASLRAAILILALMIVPTVAPVLPR
ncbi:substrate-binding domain-containing protein [Pseudomonas shahriarae]|uniref:Substrate-binding domain-containing protein n=1 Tax=Pseudomonas shahriarae TaxID=2745512 RepID=A0A9X4HC92_9PSED|nr:substrate-binding domain-containing protein [Pseudomonas shahriarae]